MSCQNRTHIQSRRSGLHVHVSWHRPQPFLNVWLLLRRQVTLLGVIFSSRCATTAWSMGSGVVRNVMAPREERTTRKRVRPLISSLAVAVEALLAVVAIVSALAAITTIRVHIHATGTLALLAWSRAIALTRYALARRATTLIALAAVVDVRRKITAANVRTALGLSHCAYALSRHAHAHATRHVTHAASCGIL